MFTKLLKLLASAPGLLTTATGAGVAARYFTTIVTTSLTVMVLLGNLSQEEADQITAMIPDLVGAFTGLIAIAIPIYAILTKAFSNKAAEVAKEVDAKIPKADTVVIQTPGTGPNIVVSAKP